MADERASTVAAWLELPSTKREIAIAQCRLSLMGREISTYEATMLALGVEILANLSLYTTPDGPKDDEDHDQPWTRGRRS